MMIGISKNHFICKNNLKIDKISFECIYKGNLTELVSGKKKSLHPLKYIKKENKKNYYFPKNDI